MVGKLVPDFFPKIFGPARTSRSTPRPSATPSRRWRARSATGAGPEEVADGFIAIAVAKMAEAIKKISVARGYDVTRYALNCFGGAGGQHACDVADALAIETVLIHPLSSLLSAYGMGLADISAHRSQGVEEPLSEEALRAARAARRRASATRRLREVASQGVARDGDQAAPARAIALRRLRHRARSRVRRRRRDAPRASRTRTSRASVSSTAPSRWSIEAVNVEAIGGAARFAERAGAIDPHAPPPAAAARDAVLLAMARGARPASSAAKRSRSARASPDRR